MLAASPSRAGANGPPRRSWAAASRPHAIAPIVPLPLNWPRRRRLRRAAKAPEPICGREAPLRCPRRAPFFF
eukprot:scaffold1589_cov111-Isochrysis_galbana.AAC.9